MNNLQQPAFPFINQEGDSLEDRGVQRGFTKLEYAAILITQGLMANSSWRASLPIDNENISTISVSLAKALIEECNK